MQVQQHYKEQLARDFPSLNVTKIEVIGHGWDNVACIVNDEWVFRFTKQRAVHRLDSLQAHTHSEIKLLQRLQNRLPVRVPNPVWISPNETYYGYKFLEGEQLSITIMPTNFIDTWVNAVIAVENVISEKAAYEVGLMPFQDNDHRIEMIETLLAKNLLAGKVLEAAQNAVSHYIDYFTQRSINRTVTMHGDLGLGNWLYDAASQSYAIIDWSDACLAPPEFQMYRLAWDIPGPTATVAQLYEERTGYAIDQNFLKLRGTVSGLSIIGELIIKGEGIESYAIQVKLKALEDWLR